MRAVRGGSARFGEISERLRRGDVTPGEALRFAMAVKRQGRATPQRTAAEAESDRQARVAAVLADLERLVGLQSVKGHIREIHAFQSIQLCRAKMGLAHEPTGLHMVFTGNPGTGKTTVARILGRLFKEMGLLSQGHLVEVERADLVGEYIGHTAQRTREVIKRAQGGLLFVDEAYSLARGGEKDFGKESIDVLVRAMEEHRGEFVLILAGYPWEMEFFLEQNPGLRSRLPLLIHFPDYGVEELLAIAEGMWRQRQYELTTEARAYLLGLLRRAAGRPGGGGTGTPWTGGEGGNARAVRNLVERSLRCQALRLVEGGELSRERLMAITRLDLERADDK